MYVKQKQQNKNQTESREILTINRNKLFQTVQWYIFCYEPDGE